MGSLPHVATWGQTRSTQWREGLIPRLAQRTKRSMLWTERSRHRSCGCTSWTRRRRSRVSVERFVAPSLRAVCHGGHALLPAGNVGGFFQKPNVQASHCLIIHRKGSQGPRIKKSNFKVEASPSCFVYLLAGGRASLKGLAERRRQVTRTP